MSSLSKQQCEPYTKDSKPLKSNTAKVLLKQLSADWCMGKDENSIVCDFSFEDYYQTIAFVNAVAWVSHQQDHHPSLTVKYNSCLVEYTTHALGGLSINDFICASKVDTVKQPEMVDPELQSSDQPRQYATEAIKLSDIEQGIELDDIQNTEPSFGETPNSIAPSFEDEDEPIFNNDGEIIIEPQLDSPTETKTDTSDSKPSYIDTQTLIMSQEELERISNATPEPAVPEPPAIDEQMNEELGDITIPDSGKPAANFSEPTASQNPEMEQSKPAKKPDTNEAQTVIMSLADLQASQNENNEEASEMEKTVVMTAPQIEIEADTNENKTEDTQKVDPAIEDDDTLVMHANTYERVKK